MKRDTDKGVRERLNQREKEREIRWLGNEYFFHSARGIGAERRGGIQISFYINGETKPSRDLKMKNTKPQ